MQKMVKIALSFEQAGFRNTIGMMQHALMKLNQFVKCDFCIKMVFCDQNCSDLLWEKIVLAIQKNFKKFLRSLEKFIQTLKGQNNLLTECIFNWFLEVSHI